MATAAAIELRAKCLQIRDGAVRVRDIHVISQRQHAVGIRRPGVIATIW